MELDMNDVNTMLYACAKAVESKLRVKPKKKRKPRKNKKSKVEIYYWNGNQNDERAGVDT